MKQRRNGGGATRPRLAGAVPPLLTSQLAHQPENDMTKPSDWNFAQYYYTLDGEPIGSTEPLDPNARDWDNPVVFAILGEDKARALPGKYGPPRVSHREAKADLLRLRREQQAAAPRGLS